MSPLSPLSPTRPNIGIGSTSPPRGSDAFTQPLGASSISKTTAQDLLNNVMGLGRPAHKADLKSSFPPHFSQQLPLHSPVRHHQRLPSSSQLQTLFSGGAGPSIWSAAPGESALGLSPRHQGNVTLPASPLAKLAPLGHTTLQAVVPGIPSTTHAGAHLGGSSSVLPPSTHGLWPPYDHMEQTLPAHTSHTPPTIPALIERNHRRIPSPSVGLNDGYADSGFRGSVVYASSPRQAPLPAHAPSTYSAQQSLPNAFNNSMVLSSTIDPPHYQSMATLGSSNYPMSHTSDALFGFSKHGDVRRQRTSGVWGDAG